MIVRRVMREIRAGSIILFHDGRPDAVQEPDLDLSVMLKSVSMLLDRLGREFTFVTIPELFRSGRPRRALWFRDR